MESKRFCLAMAAKKTKAFALQQSHGFIFASFATSREQWLRFLEML
jgi:hypothetical protein